MHVFIIPAVLSTKEAGDYCGGILIFKELLEKHADILRPVRSVSRGDSSYRREAIDRALLVAEQQGSLIHKPENEPSEMPLIRKEKRRFKRDKSHA